MEETYGPQRCVISLHNLQHFREDVERFSGLDNYSFWVKERAVKRYICYGLNLFLVQFLLNQFKFFKLVHIFQTGLKFLNQFNFQF